MRNGSNVAAISDPLAAVPSLAARHRDGEFTDAEYVALYVLHWQVARYGRRVAQRRSRAAAIPDGASWLTQAMACHGATRRKFLLDLLEHYDLRGVRRRVGVAIAHWLRGEWNLVLCHRIPRAATVLQMQAQGSRPVTVIADFPRLAAPVLDKANAFTFVCHDLEHAWQFFHDPAQCAAQRDFAGRLQQAWAAGLFTPYLDDPEFAKKFDYLAADMNTHVAHSIQYLRAVLLECLLRGEGKSPRGQLSPAGRAQLSRALSPFTSEARVGEGEVPPVLPATRRLADGNVNTPDVVRTDPSP